MKTHIEYIGEACRWLDSIAEGRATPPGKASPTQLQTINVALIMAITDLIAAIETKND